MIRSVTKNFKIDERFVNTDAKWDYDLEQLFPVGDRPYMVPGSLRMYLKATGR